MVSLGFKVVQDFVHPRYVQKSERFPLFRCWRAQLRARVRRDCLLWMHQDGQCCSAHVYIYIYLHEGRSRRTCVNYRFAQGMRKSGIAMTAMMAMMAIMAMTGAWAYSLEEDYCIQYRDVW